MPGYNAMIETEVDPFAGGDKRPSLKFETIGQSYAFTVIEAPKELQDTDYTTGEPLTWPDGNPRMKVVITVEVDGEEFGLWMKKPSALFAAVKDAARAAGLKTGIAPGTKGIVKYTGDKANEKNPRLNAAKQFAVKLTPAAPVAAADPFVDDDIAPF